MKREAGSGWGRSDGKSYLGPVGPAAHLLHDGLIGQPVVQPWHVLAIGPGGTGVGEGSEALSHHSCPALGMWNGDKTWLCPQDMYNDSNPRALLISHLQKGLEKVCNFSHTSKLASESYHEFK